MGLSRKEQVFLAILGASGVSGLTALILLLVEATSVLLPTDIKFGIVFDAGSSHTSLFLYQWPADKENGTGVVSQALACQVEGPGISSYTSNPAQAGESLQGCLEEALVLIPEAQHRKTPMFLGATAGMRLLRQKNSSQARDIFAAVTQVLGRSPVDFWGAELLAGQDEGAFGWITVNYGLGTLVKYSFTGEWIQPPEETLVGALDMGGASTQITFVPGGPILDKSTQADFRLYGSNYSVYTHSYLCFGRDQMLSRLLVGLVQSRPAALLRHPCYLSGYQTTLALAPLYESPCVHTTPPLSLPQNLTVEGTGNPGACVSAIRELFNFSSCQGQEDCAFDGIYQPPLQGKFYAFSNFYHTFHFLNLTSGQSLSTVNTTIWEFCQRPWKLVGGDQLPWAGPLAARLLCLRPVHPHPPARGLQVQRGDLAQSRVPKAGGRCGHWLDTGLHAEPDRDDPRRRTGSVVGSELRRLGGQSGVHGADPGGGGGGCLGPALLVAGLVGGGGGPPQSPQAAASQMLEPS
ncbi:ectonucleoside triphosphate diphosphohydrolase 8 isoform X1 [Rhinopithecus roxellana]|uniref:ectonucleoside triphosphate diphosphohydrolase 8 isoform X1 n=1 Tax=Rhinopithecus roxellana TaxID=61622 RepID=UPI0012373F5C|nr:ectonucleoside triphosphate diphosphohydrolase 8 isoform X1 [Rhinopithecus roxellana]